MFLRLFSALALSGLAAPALSAQSAAAPAPVQLKGGETPVRTEVQKNIDANFARLDTDSNGELSSAEMEAAQTRANQEAAAALEKRIEQEFARNDTDKDGRLTLAEFKAAVPPQRSANTAATLKKLDFNVDGKITADEFRAPILAQFDQIDTNRDGRLTADERSKPRAAPAGR